MKDWGEAGGLCALGYCSQGAFLASIAAAAETAAGAGIDPAAISLTDRLKLKNLLLDLGATHQVMVQYKGPRELGKLTGFAVSNRLRSL